MRYIHSRNLAKWIAVSSVMLTSIANGSSLPTLDDQLKSTRGTIADSDFTPAATSGSSIQWQLLDWDDSSLIQLDETINMNVNSGFLPEPAIFALLAGTFALSSFLIRRRK